MNQKSSKHSTSIRNQICRTTSFLLLANCGCELSGRFLKACYTARLSIFPILPTSTIQLRAPSTAIASDTKLFEHWGFQSRRSATIVAFLFLTLSITRQYFSVIQWSQVWACSTAFWKGTFPNHYIKVTLRPSFHWLV